MKNLFLRKVLSLGAFLFVILFPECEKFPDLPEVGECNNYLIKSGQHYSEGFNPEEFQILHLQRYGLKVSFTFTVDGSMFYNPDAEFVNGHNKIRGIVCGYKGEILAKNILKYSARITWRCPSENQIDVGCIVHLLDISGHIQKILLSDVKIGDEIFCIVEDLNEEGFYFYVQNLNTFEFAEITISKQKTPNAKVHALLESPYFGGHETAPHDINIKICSN